MADEKIPTETGTDPSHVLPEQGPLVEVTFQKNLQQKQKYLEGEPKALGVTEIALSVLNFSYACVMFSCDLNYIPIDIVHMILSLLVAIAGILAITAQNLHLPTLKACLGMQVVACAVSIFKILFYNIESEGNRIMEVCWQYTYGEFNSSNHHGPVCHSLLGAIEHYNYQYLLVNAALIAISATLAAYCCKVDNCCTSTTRMPVITIQAPPVQRSSDTA